MTKLAVSSSWRLLVGTFSALGLAASACSSGSVGSGSAASQSGADSGGGGAPTCNTPDGRCIIGNCPDLGNCNTGEFCCLQQYGSQIQGACATQSACMKSNGVFVQCQTQGACGSDVCCTTAAGAGGLTGSQCVNGNCPMGTQEVCSSGGGGAADAGDPTTCSGGGAKNACDAPATTPFTVYGVCVPH